MQNMKGWICLHRDIEDKPFWGDPAPTLLYIYLTLKANIEPKKWKKITIDRGEVVMSLPKLSLGTGLTVKQIRRSLEVLESENEIVNYRAHFYTHVRLCNYKAEQDFTQSEGHKKGSEKAQEGQQLNNETIKQIDRSPFLEFLNSLDYNNYKENSDQFIRPIYNHYWNAHKEKLKISKIIDAVDNAIEQKIFIRNPKQYFVKVIDSILREQLKE